MLDSVGPSEKPYEMCFRTIYQVKTEAFIHWLLSPIDQDTSHFRAAHT